MKGSRPTAVALRARARLLAAGAIVLVSAATGQERPGSIRLLEIDGVINPISARYLQREIERAEVEGAGAVVLRLDTPGGLVDSTREMTQAMLAAGVPVIVWVGPPGARAASAGMFVTMAAHVAAMAPGTNVGAAHPVTVGGGERQQAGAAGEKAVNDAAAMARALAAERGRNADWAERAVRESVSIPAEEAVKRDVVDLVARDLDALLDRIDGRAVVTASGRHVLRTRGASVEERPMSLPERILLAIADPNVAYVLFTLGLIGLAAELYNPGMIFPGVVGGVSLVLAFVAFGNLPLNWAGLLLLGVGVALLAADLMTEGIGFLAVGGLVAFVLGSLFLYEPGSPLAPPAPALRVSRWLVGGMSAALAAFFVLVLRALVRSRRAPVATGPAALLGRTGVASSDLAPEGLVKVDRESWTARAEGPAIHAGEPVRVVGVEGVTLRVRRDAPTAT